MSNETCAKRQRMDSGDSSVARSAAEPPALTPERVAELQAMIWSMKPDTIQARAAQFVALDASGHFSRWIEQLHAQDRAQEALQTISFAKHARTAHYVLNDKYHHLSGAAQYDASGDAVSEVAAKLDDIVARTREHSQYATKKSAVETMRCIFQILLDANGVIGHEVRKDCWDWDDKFLKIMGTFTEQELEQLATEDDGAWVDKFRATAGHASSYCILEKLQESLGDLESYQGGEKGQGEDGGEVQEEDGDDE